MSADVKIRVALRQAAEAATPPPIDRPGFEGRVRRYRNRRRVRLTMVCALTVVVATVPLVVSRAGSDSTRPAPSGQGAVELTSPVYVAGFFRGIGHATAIDPEEYVHELDVRIEEILGATYDGVILRGADSQLIRIRAVRDGDHWRFEPAPAPIPGAIGNALPSDDGTLLFVQRLYGAPVIYDLATNQVERRPDLRSDLSGVDDFTGRQVLYTTVDATWLHTGEGDAIELPSSFSPGAVGGDIVAIPDDTGMSVRLYDVSSGSAKEIGEVSGDRGDLSPDGRYYIALPAERGSPMLWELGSGEPQPMPEIGCCATDVRWVDNDTALVVTEGEAGRNDGEAGTFWVSRVLACDLQSRSCEQVYSTVGSDMSLDY